MQRGDGPIGSRGGAETTCRTTAQLSRCMHELVQALHLGWLAGRCDSK
jgi:hypothetical protein